MHLVGLFARVWVWLLAWVGLWALVGALLFGGAIHWGAAFGLSVGLFTFALPFLFSERVVKRKFSPVEEPAPGRLVAWIEEEAEALGYGSDLRTRFAVIIDPNAEAWIARRVGGAGCFWLSRGMIRTSNEADLRAVIRWALVSLHTPDSVVRTTAAGLTSLFLGLRQLRWLRVQGDEGLAPQGAFLGLPLYATVRFLAWVAGERSRGWEKKPEFSALCFSRR